jgi:hypothetical protein
MRKSSVRRNIEFLPYRLPLSESQIREGIGKLVIYQQKENVVTHGRTAATMKTSSKVAVPVLWPRVGLLFNIVWESGRPDF